MDTCATKKQPRACSILHSTVRRSDGILIEESYSTRLFVCRSTNHEYNNVLWPGRTA